MGWAERANLKSKWNKNRTSKTDVSFSTQTTQKLNVVQAATPVNQDEPVVIELTLKNIWEILCRRLKLAWRQKPHQDPALTS